MNWHTLQMGQQFWAVLVAQPSIYTISEWQATLVDE